MTTEEATTQTNDEDTHPPVVVVESSDELNAKDDDVIIAMMTGQAIEEYVYSFRQGGRTVEGLTLAGINEAANRRGGIQVDEIQFEERENSWIAIVKATDTLTGNSRYGAYEQPKRSGGREDPFAFTKAVHKAQRNAIKQLIPMPIIREVIDFYLRRKGRGAARPELAEARPRSPKEDKITNQQKAAFSLAQQLRERLDARGISQGMFWNYVRRRFNVQSRNEMGEEQWTQLAAELHAAKGSPELFESLVSRIEKVIHAERVAGEAEEGPSGRDDETTDTAASEEKPEEPRRSRRQKDPADALF